MRQETGSNQPKTVISISVRLLSSGDPFLIDDHLPKNELDVDHFLRIELISKRVLLTTQTILDCSSPHEELSSVGIFVDGDEEVVSIPDRDFVALVVVPRSMLRSLEARCSGRYEFTTALLRRPVSADAHLLLDMCEGLATVKVYDKGWTLRFVDIYDAPSIASVVYWMQRLSSVMSLKTYSLYIYRYESDFSRLLSKNFKKILYANNKRTI